MNTINRKENNKTLILFFILVIFFTLIVDAFLFTMQNEIFYLVLMWIPGLSAIIASIFQIITTREKLSFKRIVALLGFKLCNVKYMAFSFIIPLIYLLAPYIIYWIANPSDFAYTGVALTLILTDCTPTLIIGVFIGLISALGEEIGWRGFLVPRLKEKYGERKSLIISSLFWCLWHFPLIISGNYLSNIPIYYQLPMFTLCIFPIGIICGILALQTNSVWPSAFLHSAHNNYDQGVFQIITRPSDKLMYYVSETGIFTTIIAWIIAIIFIFNNKKKQKGKQSKI